MGQPRIGGKSGCGQWGTALSQIRVGRWWGGELTDPDGTPRAKAAQRANRTRQEADLVWARLLRPSLTCPRFPGFGIDVDAVELAQSGRITMKNEAAATVYKSREDARQSFRFQAMNREAKRDGFGSENVEGRYHYRRIIARIRKEMKQIG